MLQELIGLLPPRLAHLGPGVFFFVAALGIVVGFLGARLHRSVVALSLVAVGTVVGLRMPGWYGWGIDPMGTAFGAAIILGGSGYIVTTLWEGLLLAVTLASLAGTFVWLGNAPAAVWHCPAIAGSASALEAAYRIWVSLPPAIDRSLPAAVGVGAVVGAGMMIFSPRVGRALLFGIFGTMLLAIGGLLGITRIDAALLEMLPGDPWMLTGMLGCIALFFTGVQWLILPKTDSTAVERSDKSMVETRVSRESASALSREGGREMRQTLRPHKVPAFMK